MVNHNIGHTHQNRKHHIDIPHGNQKKWDQTDGQDKITLGLLVKKANGQQGQYQNENKTGNIIIKDGD